MNEIQERNWRGPNMSAALLTPFLYTPANLDPYTTPTNASHSPLTSPHTRTMSPCPLYICFPQPLVFFSSPLPFLENKPLPSLYYLPPSLPCPCKFHSLHLFLLLFYSLSQPLPYLYPWQPFPYGLLDSVFMLTLPFLYSLLQKLKPILALVCFSTFISPYCIYLSLPFNNPVSLPAHTIFALFASSIPPLSILFPAHFYLTVLPFLFALASVLPIPVPSLPLAPFSLQSPPQNHNYQPLPSSSCSTFTLPLTPPSPLLDMCEPGDQGSKSPAAAAAAAVIASGS